MAATLKAHGFGRGEFAEKSGIRAAIYLDANGGIEQLLHKASRDLASFGLPERGSGEVLGRFQMRCDDLFELRFLPGQRRLERFQDICKLGEPVQETRQPRLRGVAGIGAPALDRGANAVESGIGPRPAQQLVQFPRLLPKYRGVAAERAQRMLEQREQRHRRESTVGRVREEAEERTRRGMRQRLASGIVDLDVPAPQFARDTPRQRAIRRHKRRGLGRFFEGLAQHKCDGRRLLGGICRFDQGNPARSLGDLVRLAAFGNRAPGVCGRGRAERLPQHALAERIVRAVPVANLFARHAQSAEQLLHAELRMARIERVPACAIELAIEPRQNHRAIRPLRDGFQQLRRRRNRAGRTCRNHRPARPLHLCR